MWIENVDVLRLGWLNVRPISPEGRAVLFVVIHPCIDRAPVRFQVQFWVLEAR